MYAHRYIPLHIYSKDTNTHLISYIKKIPGGPKSSTPRGGDLKPVNKSGRKLGNITASCSDVVCVERG